MRRVLDELDVGVLKGDDVSRLFEIAKQQGFAIPAVNVTSSSTINAALETAKQVNSPIIIQTSNGGSAFLAGKGVDNLDQRASILGAQVAARHVDLLAKEYGVVVVMHTDHCAKNLLPWLDGLVKVNEEHLKQRGETLFSSHMIDLSAEDLRLNVEMSKKYLRKLSSMGMTLEIEIGITGGEEDGVDNSNVDNSRLYTQPEDIEYAYRELSKISDKFTIAATFGNVHGVYKPGNVKLKPIILKNIQEHIRSVFELDEQKPVNLVFHGSSGSSSSQIKEAVEYGVVKLNIDTDTQWAYWQGIRNYELEHVGYLETQVGNIEGEDKPNKVYYDPRKIIRSAEDFFIKRLTKAFEDLNCINRN